MPIRSEPASIQQAQSERAHYRQHAEQADRGGLKPGDELTVIALAARDGSNSGLAQELKMADGRDFKLLADAPDAPAPNSR